MRPVVLAVFVVLVVVNVEAFHLLNLLTREGSAISNFFGRKPAKNDIIILNGDGTNGNQVYPYQGQQVQQGYQGQQGYQVYPGNQGQQGAGYSQLGAQNVQPIVLYVDSYESQGHGHGPEYGPDYGHGHGHGHDHRFNTRHVQYP